MDEPEPRYVATFRPGTPELTIVALLVVLVAILAVTFTWVAREFACGEASGDCGGGRPTLIVAITGLVPAVGMFVASGRKTGHPWPWFFATAVVYGVWALLLMAWNS